jgi:NAD(P)H-hydrate epimerase
MEFPLVLTAAEMRAADQAIARALGAPTLRLMETAGAGVAEVVRREIAGAAGEVVIVCGGGSNGGDGFVAARHLARPGVPVRVLLTAPRAKIQGDAAAALAALESTAQGTSTAIEDGSGWLDPPAWRAALGETPKAAIVDAIFGTGFRGPVRDVPAAAIAAMNAAGGRKIAVDIPSGLDADTGHSVGAVFQADVTATMGARKLGLCVGESAPVGRIEVVDLGAPVEGVVGPGVRCRFLVAPGIAARLPRRSADAHKGNKGHLLVVAGSAGKTGAAFLTGTAALRSGAGLVTIASTAAGQAALDAKVVELMTARYSEGEAPEPAATRAAIEKLAAKVQAVALGPGIPTGEGMRAVVRELAARVTVPMVIDADGLNALGTEAAGILRGAAPRVLTPHPGEMARLLGLTIADVQADRIGHARSLAAATGAVVVLKGAHTIVAAPGGDVFINPAATSALATAGSGDVLTGVVGALLARGLDPLSAAQVAVYVHGAAGEALGSRLGDGVVAGDLPLEIAGVMVRLAG